MADEEPALETRLADWGSIDPPESFVAQANVTDESIRERFEAEWPECWRRAGDLLACARIGAPHAD